MPSHKGGDYFHSRYKSFKMQARVIMPTTRWLSTTGRIFKCSMTMTAATYSISALGVAIMTSLVISFLQG